MKIFLAGYEAEHRERVFRLPSDFNVFCSFYYRANTERALPQMRKDGHRGLIVLDSGAHTFFNATGYSVATHHNNIDLPDPHVFFESYIEWVKRYYPYFDYFIELDLQEIVGQKTVDKWRKRMSDLGVMNKCITVHHTCNTQKEWERLLEESESRYVALEGIRPGRKPLNYGRLIKEAYERRIRVHGFAMIKCDLLPKLPFYSVDAATWMQTVRKFGLIPIFKKDRLVRLTSAKARKAGLPPYLHNELRDSVQYRRKLMFAAQQYQLYADFLDRLWKSRGITFDFED